MYYIIGEEFAVHQCHPITEGGYTKYARKTWAHIAGNPFSRWFAMYYMDDEGKLRQADTIRYCPYCGCNLDMEDEGLGTIPNRYLPQDFVVRYRT